MIIRLPSDRPMAVSPPQHAVLQALGEALRSEQKTRSWESSDVTFSIREIAVATGLSKSAVGRLVEELVAMRLIRRLGLRAVPGLAWCVRTMRYRITTAGHVQIERYEMELTDDAFVEAGAGQAGRAFWSLLADGKQLEDRLLARRAGTSRKEGFGTLRTMQLGGLVECVDGLWQRVEGHEGDLLRAAARIYGTTGVLRARADRHEAERTSWVAKYAAYTHALHAAATNAGGCAVTALSAA
jgi:DNA-binding MarR family transcriptional regulator